jgi:hypothetical protein
MPASALRITTCFRGKLSSALLPVGLGDRLLYRRQLHGGYVGPLTLFPAMSLQVQPDRIVSKAVRTLTEEIGK